MEGMHFDPDFGWSSRESIKVERDGIPLYLRWDNTQVYRFEIDDGRYDYIEHVSDKHGTFQFFVDETTLDHDLDARGYPVTTCAFVSVDIVESRKQHELDIESAELMSELEQVRGPEDFLQL